MWIRTETLDDHAAIRTQPAPRVEHDARRISTGHEPHRELRVVGLDRAGADHHGVEQRAHAMVMRHVLGSGDPARAAVDRGDPAIQALPKVRHDEPIGTVAAEREIELDQSARFGADLGIALE